MNKKLVHTTRIPIRWGDMDAMGHVNNTVYFRYFEQARVEWMYDSGMMSDAATHGPVVINARCTFLKQLKYPGDIEVRTYVGSPGRSSFETYHEIVRTEDPHVIWAEGGAKVVWVNYAEEKSAPLPETIRNMIVADGE